MNGTTTRTIKYTIECFTTKSASGGLIKHGASPVTLQSCPIDAISTAQQSEGFPPDPHPIPAHSSQNDEQHVLPFSDSIPKYSVTQVDIAK